MPVEKGENSQKASFPPKRLALCPACQCPTWWWHSVRPLALELSWTFFLSLLSDRDGRSRASFPFSTGQRSIYREFFLLFFFLLFFSSLQKKIHTHLFWTSSRVQWYPCNNLFKETTKENVMWILCVYDTSQWNLQSNERKKKWWIPHRNNGERTKRKKRELNTFSYICMKFNDTEISTTFNFFFVLCSFNTLHSYGMMMYSLCSPIRKIYISPCSYELRRMARRWRSVRISGDDDVVEGEAEEKENYEIIFQCGRSAEKKVQQHGKWIYLCIVGENWKNAKKKYTSRKNLHDSRKRNELLKYWWNMEISAMNGNYWKIKFGEHSEFRAYKKWLKCVTVNL